MPGWRLVSDVGGTNVRFARAYPDGRIDEIERWPTSSAATFVDALSRFLSQTGGAAGCASAVIGGAGPVENGAIHLTNGRWVVREGDVAAALGGAPVRLLNDLEAIALALPVLEPDDIDVLGPIPAPDHRHAMLAVNVGTGFGAAAALPQDGGWVSVPTEAGHMSLDREDARGLGLDPATATVEDVLSGAGVPRLLEVLSGRPLSSGETPRAIFARSATDPEAGRVTALFGDILARVSGDLALATGAWGGVFLCGGVVTGWFPHADTARFRSVFEAKGKMSPRMARVFTGRISRNEAALLGLARARIGT
jgi:glucokinase